MLTIKPETFRSLRSLLCRSFTPIAFRRLVRTASKLAQPMNGALLVDHLLSAEHTRPHEFFSDTCEVFARCGLVPELLEEVLRARPLRVADIELIAQGLGLDLGPAVARAQAAVEVQPLAAGTDACADEFRRRHLVDELDRRLAERARLPGDMMHNDIHRLRLASRISQLATEIRESFVARHGSRMAGTVLDRATESGAFGQVWQATLLHDRDRQMATKIFHMTQLATGVQLRYFRRGGRAMEILEEARGDENPAIVRLHAISVDTLAFSMPFLPGGNLAHIASHRWSLETKLEKFRTICEAIAYAHRNGVIHRDITPYNVVLDEHETPMIADFDIADSRRFSKLSLHARMGAQGFAAPEQWHRRGEIDHRVDVYSLGRLLTYMLREEEFDARMTPRQALRGLRHIPPALIEVLMSACDLDPNNRPDSVDELIRALDRNDLRMRGLPPPSRAGGTMWLTVPLALQGFLVYSAIVHGPTVHQAVHEAVDPTGRTSTVVERSPPSARSIAPIDWPSILQSWWAAWNATRSAKAFVDGPMSVVVDAPAPVSAVVAPPDVVNIMPRKRAAKPRLEPEPADVRDPMDEPSGDQAGNGAAATTLAVVTQEDFDKNPDLAEVKACRDLNLPGMVVEVDVAFHVNHEGWPVVDSISPYSGNVAGCVRSRIEMMRLPTAKRESGRLRWHHHFK